MLSHLRNAIACFFLLLVAEARSDLIPSDRITDWSIAGVPGGIPSYPVWTNMSGLDSSGATDCRAAIQAALDACPAGYAVKLPAGIFRIESMLSLTHTNVLRGSGSNSTTVLMAFTSGGSTAGIRIGVAIGGDTTWTNAVTAIKGSTNLSLLTTTGLAVSNIVAIEQLNDNDLVWNASDEGGAVGQDWYYGTNYVLAQMLEIRSIDGTNVTFWPPLNWTWTNSLNAKLHRKGSGVWTYGCGIEDLTVGQTTSNGDKNVDLMFAKYSWVYRVNSTNCYKYHCQVQGSLACEVRQSSFIGAQGSGSGGSYGVAVAFGSTACLIEDNIFSDVISAMIYAEMAQGNVFGYNFVHRIRYSPSDFLQMAMSVHDGHPMMNLFEGNVGTGFISDLIHGSSSHQTLFRNRLVAGQTQTNGGSTWTTKQNRGIQWDNHNRYGIGIANVLGNTNISFLAFTNGPNNLTTTVPVLEAFGYTSVSPGVYTDSQAYSTAILLGNYLIGTGSDGVPARESVGATNIPASLYLSSKPSWFGRVPWPPIGSDVSGITNAIPAHLRFSGVDYIETTASSGIVTVGTLIIGP